MIALLLLACGSETGLAGDWIWTIDFETYDAVEVCTEIDRGGEITGVGTISTFPSGEAVLDSQLFGGLLGSWSDGSLDVAQAWQVEVNGDVLGFVDRQLVAELDEEDPNRLTFAVDWAYLSFLSSAPCHWNATGTAARLESLD